MNHLSPCLQRLSTLLLLTRPVVLTVMYWWGILYFPQDGGSCPTWPPLRFMPMCSDKQTIILCVTPITHWLTVYINWMWLEASCLLFFNYLFLTPHFLLETVHRHSVELSSSTNLLELNDLFSDKKRTFMKIFYELLWFIIVKTSEGYCPSSKCCLFQVAVEFFGHCLVKVWKYGQFINGLVSWGVCDKNSLIWDGLCKRKKKAEYYLTACGNIGMS